MRTWIIMGAIVVVGLIAWTAIGGRGTSALDGFSSCLGEKGATFYGAFWCPHCQNQKKLFGGSARLLPYVECSTPDGRAQLGICKEKNIDTYPTWGFADGSRESGELSLQRLSEKTGCVLPQ